MGTEQNKKKKWVKIGVLLLVNLFVAHVVYNFVVAEKNTPISVSLKRSIFWGFWRAKARTPARPRKKAVPKVGVVTGVVCSAERPCAIIGSETVSEGDILDGVKITRIGRGEVEFEKDGKVWKQLVGEHASNEWTTRLPKQ
jgi:hypothetical protein